MKFRTQKITALMASAIVGVSTLGSVSVMAAESTEAMADQAGMVVDRDAIAADGDAIPSDFIQGTFKPSETTVQAQDSYEYPFLGLTMKLPEEHRLFSLYPHSVWHHHPLYQERHRQLQHLFPSSLHRVFPAPESHLHMENTR